MIIVALYVLILGIVMIAGGAPSYGTSIRTKVVCFFMSFVGVLLAGWASTYLASYIMY